jgi:hypothetical protein
MTAIEFLRAHVNATWPDRKATTPITLAQAYEVVLLVDELTVALRDYLEADIGPGTCRWNAELREAAFYRARGRAVETLGKVPPRGPLGPAFVEGEPIAGAQIIGAKPGEAR